MLNITVNLESGRASLAQSTAIKAGGNVPVEVTFSSPPGDNALLELALSPQSSTRAVLAYLDEFTPESSLVWRGDLDANDSRLIDELTGKQAQTVDVEFVLASDTRPRQPFANFSVGVQSPTVTGPESSEGGPTYYTQAQAEALFQRKDTISAGALINKVSTPADSTAAGDPGDFAVSAGYLYLYTGDGTTHTWLRIAGANEF